MRLGLGARPLNSGVRLHMTAQQHVCVARFRNDTDAPMTLYLEMLCEEVVLAPGHKVDLLALPLDDLLPLSISYVEGGLQIHPYKVADPDWHVRFRDRVIRAGHTTILAEYE